MKYIREITIVALLFTNITVYQQKQIQIDYLKTRLSLETSLRQEYEQCLKEARETIAKLLIYVNP